MWLLGNPSSHSRGEYIITMQPMGHSLLGPWAWSSAVRGHISKTEQKELKVSHFLGHALTKKPNIPYGPDSCLSDSPALCQSQEVGHSRATDHRCSLLSVPIPYMAMERKRLGTFSTGEEPSFSFLRQIYCLWYTKLDSFAHFPVNIYYLPAVHKRNYVWYNRK